tara:strand:+ start:67 stop:690 length:624 start_codon:yes stop_codon:yes gene_type:complete
MPLSVQYKGQHIWKKYFASNDQNKNQNFYKKMNEKYAEIEDEVKKIEELIDEVYKKKEEMKELAQKADLPFGGSDVEYTDETDYFIPEGEIYVNDKKLKLGISEKRDLFEGKNRRGFETYDDKTTEIYEKGDWYITTETIDEGWFEYQGEEEEKFEKSKLDWDGETLQYGDDYVSDDIGTKNNGDVENMLYFPNLPYCGSLGGGMEI